MNIYKVTKTDDDYPDYDSFVCYAESEEEARLIHPDKELGGYVWTSDHQTLEVVYLGTCTACTSDAKAGVILASFSAE